MYNMASRMLVFSSLPQKNLRKKGKEKEKEKEKKKVKETDLRLNVAL